MANQVSPANVAARIQAKSPRSVADTPSASGASGQIREKSTGARSVIRSLEELGVEVVFGLPGGAILPVYDPLYSTTRLKHVLVRHEQGAGHAAEGYAISTGKVGVCIATSGPGATNLVTALLDANLDSVPLVAITGQVGASAIGTDAFQEADIVGATMPLTKHSFLVTRAHEIPARIAEAFHLAQTGRPGPVIVDITKSAQNEIADFVWPPKLELPGYVPSYEVPSRQIRRAAELIAQAKRPVLYVGGGAIRSGANAEISHLSKIASIPVTTTLTALGAVSAAHPNFVGMPGMHGTVPAVGALQKSDVLVALGARFDDRVTGKLESFAPDAKVIHVDIDPAEIGKNRYADVPIVGDVREAVEALTRELDSIYSEKGYPTHESWWKFLNSLREKFPPSYEQPADGLMPGQFVVERLREVVGEIAGDDVIWATGVGQHQMWAAQFLNVKNPRTFINSGGAGTMGYGIPAGMGAKAGNPEKTVWVIDGDGSFQMTNQELATCRLNGINIKVALINNSSLGMVRQWQNLFYGERYSFTDLNTGHGSVHVPDFVKMADAYDCAAFRVEKAEEVDEVIRKAMAINDRPVVIDFVTSPDAQVWPMIAAGVPNDDIQYARGLRPDFSEFED